jgi:glycosyltransferase involved in cell wall biosynthesis
MWAGIVGKHLEDRPAISIVVPVYNEEESALPLYTSIRKACEPLGKAYEAIFVDDGSKDQTFAILEQIHKKDSRVRVIRFRKNYGQTAAMAAGFMHARGKIIVSMDGDLQNDPHDIPRLLAKLEEGYDVVCGWRKNRQDKFWARRVPSIVANRIIGWVTGLNIHDNGCSLKAYRALVIKNLALYGEMHRFIPAMATLTGARIAEIEVNHHPRRFGQSKYGIGRIWRVVLDIISVKMITGFASRPALWFGLPSFPFFILGSSALFFASGMYSDRRIEEWLVISTVAFLFFLLGAHLLTLGIIGELSMKTGDFLPSKTIRPTLTVM